MHIQLNVSTDFELTNTTNLEFKINLTATKSQHSEQCQRGKQKKRNFAQRSTYCDEKMRKIARSYEKIPKVITKSWKDTKTYCKLQTLTKRLRKVTYSYEILCVHKSLTSVTPRTCKTLRLVSEWKVTESCW